MCWKCFIWKILPDFWIIYTRKVSLTRRFISLCGHVMPVKRNTGHNVRKHKIPKCATFVHITHIVSGQEFYCLIHCQLYQKIEKNFNGRSKSLKTKNYYYNTVI